MDLMYAAMSSIQVCRSLAGLYEMLYSRLPSVVVRFTTYSSLWLRGSFIRLYPKMLGSSLWCKACHRFHRCIAKDPVSGCKGELQDIQCRNTNELFTGLLCTKTHQRSRHC